MPSTSPEEETTMSSATLSNHDIGRDLQRDARAWSEFSGMKYTQALRLMKHPLAQGILGERISARKLIAVMTGHPVLSEPIWDLDASGAEIQTDERATHLGESGLWAAKDRPFRIDSRDTFVKLVLTAEVLRMFSSTAEPNSTAHSYNLKHTAEEFFAEWLGAFSHVDNGTAIWAAAALDIPITESNPGECSLNANIGLDPQQVDYATRMRRNQRVSGIPIKVHHHRPPGYLHLLSALEQYKRTGQAPARWNGVDEKAEPLTSPFHEWLIAQVDPSGARGAFGSRECLAYDYRAGVQDGDHGVAMLPEELVRLLVDYGADDRAVIAARRAVLDWVMTSPYQQGIRTELVDHDRAAHGGWGAGPGDIERYEFRCPCENGVIREEHENVPGFREHDVRILCPKCRDEWQFVPGLSIRGWRIESIAENPAA